MYNATKYTQLQATLPNYVVFHSYNSFSFPAENLGAGFSCSTGQILIASNGYLQESVSRLALFDLQWITKNIGLMRLQYYKHKTMQSTSPH